GTAIHFARPGNSYTDPATGFLYAGIVDVMNPTYRYGRRALPSALIALVLNDAYGYTIATPAGFATGASPPSTNIIVAGAEIGGPPVVQVYDAPTAALRFSFYAYDPGFTGGVRVALGKVNGNNIPTIITAPGPGARPAIRIFDGTTGALIREFLAYDPAYQ